MPKGQHHTEDAKQKIRLAMLGNKHSLGCHPSDEARHRMSQARAGHTVPDETKRKISLSKIGHPVSAETRLKLSLINKGRKYSLERNAKMSASLTGKHHTPETRHKMSEHRKADWQNPDWRARNIAGQQNFLKNILSNNPEWGKRRIKAMMDGLRQVRRREALTTTSEDTAKQVHLSSEHRAKIGDLKRRSWQDPAWRSKVIQSQIEGRKRAMERDPEWRVKQIRAQRKGYSVFPNKAETSLLSLLEQDYPSEWSFVGDGSFIIGDCNPDFANVKGHKELIELFGDHWHKGQNPQSRIDLFQQFGFRTLVVWERELKYPDKVRERIDEFVKGR